MARVMWEKNITLYRTLVRALTKPYGDGEPTWTAYAYGPYDNKNVNRDYGVHWGKQGALEYHVLKQELKPVLNLTDEGGLVLGLEWVTYETDGKASHVH